MKMRISRRSLLKGTAAAAGAAGLAMLYKPTILAAAAKGAAPSDRCGIAMIGVGVRGEQDMNDPAVKREQLVAFCDVDEKKWGQAGGAKTYFDYRKMFDEMHKDIDAVFVATPNHHHFLPAMIAMQLGKGAYVEKPMAHSIEQARQMAEASLKYKVPTQMGNQGHYGEGTAKCVEHLQAGTIGKVTEVHCWTDRANGGSGGRPPTQPVPQGMHWEEWIGPSPFRDYHKDLHPHEFHNWYDFGNGSVGNMACHICDCAVVGLKLQAPTSITAEALLAGSAEQYPRGTRVRMDFAARGDMPPLKFYWWDGVRAGNSKEAQGDWQNIPANGQNRPLIAEELEKKYGRKLGGCGTVYVGEKGYFYTGTYGGEAFSSLPDTLLKEAPVPAKTQPRASGGSHGHLIQCVKDKTPVTLSNFPVASVLTEIILLVNLAQKAGAGKTVQWDGPNMKCTNMPELSKLVHLEYRKGWSPDGWKA
jgi:predicted dehydrogenase